MRWFTFPRRRFLRGLSVTLLWGAGFSQVLAASPPTGPAASVDLADLTTTELQARQQAGVDTVLVPIGATEQSGPHMALGKHNVRVHFLAGEIARTWGRAVVAPVLAYVPEGTVTPPQGHMRFTGTISIPTPVFEGVLEGTARSFHQHGFRHVVFLGDHGGYQHSLETVANRLNKEWKGGADGPAVIALTGYYRAAEDFDGMLKAQGFSTAEIGLHAGLADTALMMAVDPSLVRVDRLRTAGVDHGADGVRGQPARATSALGQPGIRHIIDTSVAALRAQLPSPSTPSH
ncbi:creatininase family protein [Ideonella oryzae]|uniref:Creatininase family protein n=1 Tax=Ideonella oryzae TaxID=2937441 RepID=A0ABT1BMA8_9BURK|nr:creatininase family protein [Ideonella oryzae]MCO5976979.1 creatininase family protein [Ideonella oryzae]